MLAAMRLAAVAFGLLAITACGKKHGASGDDGADTDAAADCTTQGCPLHQKCSADHACVPECAMDTDCPAMQKCDVAAGACVGGCGGNKLDLTYVPPNLMLALDRSCSMTDVVDAATGTTKWGAAVASLHDILGIHGTDIRWGLALFPDTTTPNCSQAAPVAPVADGNAPTIDTILHDALAATDPNYPDGPCVTNIDTGIQSAAADPALLDAGRSSYLMLITDGKQSGCSAGGGNPGTEATVQDMHDNKHVTTFVVGFGNGVNANEMNKLADLGGAPLAGTTHYYQADTPAQLATAFANISNLVVSCDYHVDPAPPDLAMTYVFFDGTEVIGRDTTHAHGWDYDPATQTLTFYGTDCDRLKTHAVTDVDVEFGCPTPPVN